MNDTYIVYFLSGKNKTPIFYVGVTSKSLKERLSQHKSDTRNLFCTNKNEKIIELNYEIEIHEIEIHEIYSLRCNKEVAGGVERKYIQKYLKGGYNLVNGNKINDRANPYDTDKVINISTETHLFLKTYLKNTDRKIGKFIECAILEKIKKEKKKQ